MVVSADKDKCLRCGGCVSVCPKNALNLSEHGIICDPKLCITCKICVNFCPVAALKAK
jgi:Fe-S-cluster-containing hydrogenase component 2